MPRNWITFEEHISVELLSEDFCYTSNTDKSWVLKSTSDFQEVLKDFEDGGLELDKFSKVVYEKLFNKKGNDKKKQEVLGILVEKTVDFYIESDEYGGVYCDEVKFDSGVFSFLSYSNPRGEFDYVYEDTYESFSNAEEYFQWVENKLEKEKMKDTNVIKNTWVSYCSDHLLIDDEIEDIASSESFEEYKKDFIEAWGKDNPIQMILYHY